ncbi:MAG: hypothetical protein M1831_005662 [Alyxoria varia]|nr:MAG: hypothetical protein M1831_005662 [Alyxoria varia]
MNSPQGPSRKRREESHDESSFPPSKKRHMFEDHAQQLTPPLTVPNSEIVAGSTLSDEPVGERVESLRQLEAIELEPHDESSFPPSKNGHTFKGLVQPLAPPLTTRDSEIIAGSTLSDEPVGERVENLEQQLDAMTQDLTRVSNSGWGWSAWGETFEDEIRQYQGSFDMRPQDHSCPTSLGPSDSLSNRAGASSSSFVEPSQALRLDPGLMSNESVTMATREPNIPTSFKTVPCPGCDDHPGGFHDELSFKRHIEQAHTSDKKVWVCINPTPGDKFLGSCTACKNERHYKAEYKAADHLRRMHFRPRKTRDRARNIIKDKQRGPPMEELKTYIEERHVQQHMYDKDENIQTPATPTAPGKSLSLYDPRADVPTQSSADLYAYVPDDWAQLNWKTSRQIEEQSFQTRLSQTPESERPYTDPSENSFDIENADTTLEVSLNSLKGRSSLHRLLSIVMLNFVSSIYHMLYLRKCDGSNGLCCGLRMFDDYFELEHGALNELQASLNAFPHSVASKPSWWRWLRDSLVSQPAGSQQDSSHGSVRLAQYSHPAANATANVSTSQKASRDGNSVQRQQENQPSISNTSQSSWAYTVMTKYLLLVLPHKQTALKLDHMDSNAEANSDRAFFSNLREHYAVREDGVTGGGIISTVRKLFSLRTLLDIRFVHFEAFHGGLAQVHQVDTVPPAEEADTYEYRPMPPKYTPPIGPNLSLHLYHYPEDADERLVLVYRLPKKKNGPLLPCLFQGYRYGWGLSLVEGVSKVRPCFIGLLGAVVSLIFGIAWSASKGGDVQGGFTIAAYLMMMFSVAVGSLRGMLEE